MKVQPVEPDLLSSTPFPADAAPALPADGARACERVTSLFGEHLDGSLPELLRVGIDQHLSDCPGCRRASDEYLAVIRLAGSLPPVPPPPAVASRLLAALRDAAARPRTGELDDTRSERPLA